MATSKKTGTTQSVDLKKLARVLNKSADEAGKTLPQEQRVAYRAARDSVVRARRSAENVEGQLRIG
jgi:hypothetical protein